jgi:hypothetical protein
VKLRETIQTYYSGARGEHDSHRSWEYCYCYFRNNPVERIAEDRDHASLQLGFYLASWGMYRGSSFLPKFAYTIHRGAVDQLVAPRFAELWKRDSSTDSNKSERVGLIMEAIAALREAYRPFAPREESRQASDTLLTKIILGTFGCLPACDRYFIDGFRSEGHKYSYLNAQFVERALHFCSDNVSDLHEEHQRIQKDSGIEYPLMKLVDMYFWQIGWDRSQENRVR